MRAGIANAGGSEEAYIKALRLSCAEFESHAAAIAQSLAAMDWKSYALKLHAMKGLFATIGAGPLSSMASRLETASRAGDADTCRRETQNFCRKMRGLGECLRAAPVKSICASMPKTHPKRAELAGKLAQLKAACLKGNSDDADALSEYLETVCLDAQIDAALARIISLAESLDYGKAAKKIDDLLTALSPCPATEGQ